MDPVVLILGLVVLGLCSGIFGALFGLGGGVIFVPILLFIVDEPTQAVAISLIGIIAGSVGASTVLVKEGMSNVRLGLLLEITTCIGAIAGAVIATYLDSVVLMVLFAVIIVYSAFRMIINPERIVEPTEGSEGTMTFTFNDESTGNEVKYDVQNIRSGMALCTVAGALSSMTGIGGGAVKVPLMNIHMHIPMKAASSTSSYMIGITAFSGAITYFFAGQVLLLEAAGVAIGAFAGSLIGTHLARRISSGHLRKYFSVVLFIMAAIVLLQAGGVI